MYILVYSSAIINVPEQHYTTRFHKRILKMGVHKYVYIHILINCTYVCMYIVQLIAEIASKRINNIEKKIV